MNVQNSIRWPLVVAVILMAAAPVSASTLIRQSFDRQVINSDVFVVGVVTSVAPCGGQFDGLNCGTFRTVQVMKGEIGATFRLGLNGSLPGTNLDCCVPGKLYAMALHQGYDEVWFSHNGVHSIYPLVIPEDVAPATR